MLENISDYQKEINKLLENNNDKTNWHFEKEFFQTKIQQIQHERLVHLLVTLAVGLGCLISCLFSLSYYLAPLFILDSILMFLFLAYIIHYRKLENTTQGCYQTLDKIQQKLKEII